MKFSDEQKQKLVALYYNGVSVSDICLQSGVPRSTFYTWLKPYQTQVTPSGHIVSTNEFIKMKQRLEKLEQKIEVLQKVDCTVSPVSANAVMGSMVKTMHSTINRLPIRFTDTFM